MTKEQLYEAFGNINEKHVEAAEQKPRKKHLWVKWGVLAACLCLVAGGGYCYKLEHPYPKKEVVSGQPQPAMEHGTEKTGYMEPKWEDLKIYAQYPELSWNGTGYHARKGIVLPEQLGNKLSEITASAMAEDSIETGEPVSRERKAALYEIAGISVECAVAVRYEGEEQCYAAVNYLYYPQTLEQFIADLNLRENLTFGTAYYSYRKTFSGERATICFEDVDSAKIWELLLANPAAENVYSEELLKQERPKKLLGISINIPLLGYENISLAIMDRGYIQTNILDTGKLFYIGEEYTEAFVEYVLKECEGYEIIPVYNVTDATEESATEESATEAGPTEAPVKHIIEE